MFIVCSFQKSNDFYPRPPRGGRLGRLKHLDVVQVISTHALREEGDVFKPGFGLFGCKFLPTPSARRATSSWCRGCRHDDNFYPRPPRGGRPSRTRLSAARCCNFYPRPPRGGRPTVGGAPLSAIKFLPTPSARRATAPFAPAPAGGPDFYPRPPRGGRRAASVRGRQHHGQFLPTPSARRATGGRQSGPRQIRYFYPRPPRGGRLVTLFEVLEIVQFLPTPSARRATEVMPDHVHLLIISTHALREEGDPGPFPRRNERR